MLQIYIGLEATGISLIFLLAVAVIAMMWMPPKGKNCFCIYPL